MHQASSRARRTGPIPSLPTYLVVDVVAVSIALVIAHVIRFGLRAALLPGPDIPYVLIAVVAVPIWTGVLALAGSYDRRTVGAGTDEYRSVVDAGVHFLAVVAVLHFLFGLVIARGFVGVLVPVAVVLTLAARFGLRSWLYRQRTHGRYVRRTLLVGSPATVVDVGEHLMRADGSAFDLVGACVDVAGDSIAVAGRRIPVLCPPGDIATAIRLVEPDTVALTDEAVATTGPDVAALIDHPGIDLLVAPAVTDVAGPRTVLRSLAGLPLLHVEEPTFTGPQRVAKEAMDRLTSAIALAVLAPVFAAVAVAIRMDSPGPVFFRQVRVGREGRPFRMVKFRTMVDGAESLLPELESSNDADGLLFKLRADPRVTRVGRALRRSSIDELPQLWNVLRGDMSLVGPRPPLPSEVDLYEAHVSRRLLVKPGMTGLWQVSGRADLPWDDAVRLDLYYVDHWSPTMDLIIAGRTFSAVLRGSGAY